MLHLFYMKNKELKTDRIPGVTKLIRCSFPADLTQILMTAEVWDHHLQAEILTIDPHRNTITMTNNNLPGKSRVVLTRKEIMV